MTQQEKQGIVLMIAGFCEGLLSAWLMRDYSYLPDLLIMGLGVALLLAGMVIFMAEEK